MKSSNAAEIEAKEECMGCGDFLFEMESDISDRKTNLAFRKLSGRGGEVIDKEGAVALLEERVKEGDTNAMWILGLCFKYGMGCDQNFDRAESLFKRSQDAGNLFATVASRGYKGDKDVRMVYPNMSDEMKMRIGEVVCVAPWTYLDMKTVGIGFRGAESFGQALKVNTTLTDLNLGWNRLRDEGIKAISEGLKSNSTLLTLYLTSNMFGVEGTQMLSEALTVNTTLRKLWLGSNRIGNEGARIVSEALKRNTTLRDLCIDYNDIDDEGAKALSEGLRVNSTLTDLNLWMNHIGEEGAKMLRSAANSSLKELNMKDNYPRKE